MLDYGDRVVITITKVRDEYGDRTHWEYDVERNGSVDAGGTGPSFASVVDGAYDYIANEMGEWADG